MVLAVVRFQLPRGDRGEHALRRHLRADERIAALLVAKCGRSDGSPPSSSGSSASQIEYAIVMWFWGQRPGQIASSSSAWTSAWSPPAAIASSKM
jgi:hypothetical protein